MTEPELIDLSKLDLPPTTLGADLEFDERFLGNAIDHLLKIRNESVDYVVDPGTFGVLEVENAWKLWIETQDGMKIFEPTNWARNQTIGVTELPRKYHDALIERGHLNEAASHINMWLDEGSPRQIRTIGEGYRALVGPSYMPFDNYDAFIQVADSLKLINGQRTENEIPAQFKKVEISDHNMYVQIIDANSEWDIGGGDTYKKMMIIKNSEVGDGAMLVEAGLWRSMCSNLMLHGVISRRIHKGEKLDAGIFAPDTRVKQNELWKLIVRDSINAGITSDVLYDDILNGVIESKEIKVEPMKAVELIATKEKLSEEDKNAIIQAMLGDSTIKETEKNTVFQISNGITQAAKGMGIERGREMNKLGGDIQHLIKIVA